MRKSLSTFMVVTALLGGAPALAQYTEPGRGGAGRVADEIVRTVEDTARAVGRVRNSLDQSINEVRFPEPERFAIDACRPSVERYGRMRVDDVRPYKRGSLRVYGTTGGYAVGYGDRYRNRPGAPRSFTCTVRTDGRVKLKTKRLRRY